MSRKNKLENGIERLFSSSKSTTSNGETMVPPPPDPPKVEVTAAVEPAPVIEKKPATAKPPRPKAKDTPPQKEKAQSKPQAPVEPAQKLEPPRVKAPEVEDVKKIPEPEASAAPVVDIPLMLKEIKAAEAAVETTAEKPILNVKDEPTHQQAVETPKAAPETMQQTDEKIAALIDELQYSEDEHLVIFRLNEQIYGVSIMVVESIIKNQAITPVPRAPYSIVGVTNLRGVVLPVINMHQRLELEELEDSQHTRIIIINKSDVSAGLMVDEVLAVAKIDATSITPPSPVIYKTQTQYIKGIAKFDSHLVILLDLDKVFESIATRIGAENVKRAEKM